MKRIMLDVAVGLVIGVVIDVAASWLWLCFGPDYDLGCYP